LFFSIELAVAFFLSSGVLRVCAGTVLLLFVIRIIRKKKESAIGKFGKASTFVVFSFSHKFAVVSFGDGGGNFTSHTGLM
jgi:hypothetical protein